MILSKLGENKEVQKKRRHRRHKHWPIERGIHANHHRHEYSDKCELNKITQNDWTLQVY